MNKQIEEIAARVRELREISEYTTEDMASKLGITENEYIDYESAKNDFPVSLLYSIAAIFKIDMTELLTGSTPRLSACSIVRKGEGIAVDRYKGYDFESIAYKFINRKIEPMIVTVGEDTEHNPPDLVRHNGQEFNYVLEGSIKVIFGKNEFILNEGDCFYFDPAELHAQTAFGGKQAKFLTVILL